jgi:hypothetical protein
MSTEIENGGGAPAAVATPENNSQNSASSNAGESPQGTNGTVSSTPSSDWREALGEEYRANKSIQNYKNVNDLVKSHLHLEKMLGAKSTPIIGEEGKTVYEADAYKYNVEEGKPNITPEIFDKVSAKAAALQIPPAQFQELVNEFLGAESELIEAGKAAAATELKTAEDSLKKEWGANFEENLTNAHKAFELFATPELKQEVSNLPMSVKTSITKMMSSIYSKIGETSLQKQGGEKNSLTAEQATAKIREIRNNPDHPYHKNDPAARADMAKLYLAADGKE